MIADIRLPKACACLIGALLTGCIYDPGDDNNYTYIDPNYAIAPVEINLQEVGDTIDVGGSVNFSYDITGYAIDKPYNIFFKVGETTGQLNGFSGTFNYNPDIFEGYLELTINVSTNSGTGSLADKNLFERIVYTRSWVLNINTRDPQKGPAITSIAPFEGTLRISWEEFDKPNFAGYAVYRDGVLMSMIEDPSVTSTTDPNYLGGQASYSVRINLKNGNFVSGNSGSFFTEPSKIVKSEVTADGQLRVYWSKCLYPNNFKGYEIYMDGAKPDAGPPAFSTIDVSDTTAVLTPSFGSKQISTVLTYGQMEGQDYRNPLGYAEYVFGEEIDEYEVIAIAPTANRYFTRKAELLNAYTLDTRELVATAPITRNVSSLVVSDDQTTVVAIDYSKVYAWELSNLNLRHQLEITQIAPNSSIRAVGSPGDNTLLLGKTTSAGTKSIMIYNASNDVVEKEYVGNVEVAGSLQMSNDSKFIIIKEYGVSRLVKLEANNTTTQGITNFHNNVFFHPDDNAKVITGSDLEREQGAVYVQDRETSMLVENIATPPMTVLRLDAKSGIVFGALTDGSGQYVAFDYKNQKVLLRLKGLTTSEPVLAGNYLYSSQGARLRLK